MSPSKKIKYLGINVIKETKELYADYYQTLLERKKTLITRKTSHLCKLENIILLRCQNFPKQSTNPV